MRPETADPELVAALAHRWDTVNKTPTCDHCGGSMTWEDCSEHGCDEGYTAPGLLHEMDPDWYDEDDTEPCGICEGTGGWWFCPDRQCSLDRLDEGGAR